MGEKSEDGKSESGKIRKKEKREDPPFGKIAKGRAPGGAYRAGSGKGSAIGGKPQERWHESQLYTRPGGYVRATVQCYS
jgi:hypothetical protein